MPNGNKDDLNTGAKRATEVHDAMLGLPGYADDSMFFVVRYISKAKEELRECDFEEFMSTFGEMEKVPKDNEGHDGAADGTSSCERAQALREKALAIIKDCPDLVRDYERFTLSARAAKRAVGTG